jgi:hypothetical protein
MTTKVAPELLETTIASGTYTPSALLGASMTSCTPSVCQWMRVGNVVTVSGKASVDMAAGVNSLFRLSLPVASNFADDGQAAGTASGQTLASSEGRVYADTVDDRLAVNANFSLGVSTIWFHATYLVV